MKMVQRPNELHINDRWKIKRSLISVNIPAEVRVLTEEKYYQENQLIHGDVSRMAEEWMKAGDEQRHGWGRVKAIFGFEGNRALIPRDKIKAKPPCALRESDFTRMTNLVLAGWFHFKLFNRSAFLVLCPFNGKFSRTWEFQTTLDENINF